MALISAINIYNNTIHSSTKIEPTKAFKFTKKKDLNMCYFKYYKITN